MYHKQCDGLVSYSVSQYVNIESMHNNGQLAAPPTAHRPVPRDAGPSARHGGTGSGQTDDCDLLSYRVSYVTYNLTASFAPGWDTIRHFFERSAAVAR